MHIDDAIHGISTIIIVQTSQGNSQGSGFFYQALGPKDPSKQGQWINIEETWLVTNRHVVLPKINNNEIFPDLLSFHLRKANGSGIIWEPLELNRQDLLARARFHPDPEVDVCVVRVLDLLTDRIKSGDRYVQWYGVSKENLPGQNKISPHVASDAVVIGYPRGFFDQVNLYPIVKSGIIASRWGANFDGKPYFLIDAKLFPGSSGSIVISKPTDVVIENGHIFHSKDKQFAFLGIYSGEPYLQHQPIELEDQTIIKKSGYNLGIVWYANLVEEIINQGVTLSST